MRLNPEAEPASVLHAGSDWLRLLRAHAIGEGHRGPRKKLLDSLHPRRVDPSKNTNYLAKASYQPAPFTCSAPPAGQAGAVGSEKRMSAGSTNFFTSSDG